MINTFKLIEAINNHSTVKIEILNNRTFLNGTEIFIQQDLAKVGSVVFRFTGAKDFLLNLKHSHLLPLNNEAIKHFRNRYNHNLTVNEKNINAII